MEYQNNIYRVKSISELHHFASLGKPKHPLISIIDYSKVSSENVPESARFVCEFYSVNFKNNCSMVYGRHFFDHDDGTLLCTAPEQVIQMQKSELKDNVTGWGLFFHPEFIRNTSLGRKINKYTYFSYDEKEALHLSADERNVLLGILMQIEKEYQTYTDIHSHDLMISNLELLLNYCLRFYGRQFHTRTNHHKDIISKFEHFITEYIHSDELKKNGVPTVKFCAEQLNLSPNYFSDILKSETGKSARQHIQYHLLDRAKNMLLGSDSSVNEIAAELGFEYPQNLSKLFKNKTRLTPVEYRNNSN
jgi:AraC-like DNA-binding protein